MSHFIKHTSCDNCGSSDAFAIYSDGGGHCFSCHHHTGPTTSPYVTRTASDGSLDDRLVLPIDCDNIFPEEAVAWLAKYELNVEDMLRNNVLWSPARSQLIYCFYGNEGELVAYQARNFSPKARTKYYTKGSINDILPIYSQRAGLAGLCESRPLVVVEDCASAIKLSNCGLDAMPALGSDLPLYKITQLSHLYSNVLVWLDGNMFHKAQKIADRFNYLGVKAWANYTELDPKEIPYIELKEIAK